MTLAFKADPMKFQDDYYHAILFYYLIEDLLMLCRSIVKNHWTAGKKERSKPSGIRECLCKNIK